MSDGLRERKKRETRLALSLAAVKLVVERGWNNVTIEDFLEAALAWAQSTGMGASQGEPSWQAFAAFLYCGKSYE